MKIDDGGPILLSDTVAPTAGQSSFVLSSRMQNPSRRAILVDEIRYRISGFSQDTPWMGAFRVNHSVGRVPLTNGFIPMGILAPDMGQDIQASEISLTWRLPRPLYVPGAEYLATGVLNASGTTTSFGNIGTASLTVTYAGRLLPPHRPVPKRILVPWATYWQPPSFTGTSSISAETSKEGDLFNPFNAPLRVQRFIGRVFIDETSSGSGWVEMPGAASADPPVRMLSDRSTIRATDSFGRILVRDPAPWPHLFYFPTRTWTVNSLLQPKGFYKFTLTRDFRSMDPGPQTNVFQVGLIGHREVVLR